MAKSLNFSINTILLALSSFFLTWGEGMQNVLPNASSYCLVFIALLIICNCCILLDFRNYYLFYLPTQYKYFIIFVIVHTFLFLLFNPDYFVLGKAAGRVASNGFEFQKANSGEIVIRYFFFFIFSLLLSFLLRIKKKFETFSFFFCLGFSVSILLGGYQGEYSGGLVRFSGGLSDPNAMSFDCLISLFVAFFSIMSAKSKFRKYIFIAFLSIAIFALIMAFSRGAILAFSVCLLYYLYRMGVFKSFRITFLLLVCICVAFLLANKISSVALDEVFNTRFAINEIADNGGAGRLDIWNIYLSHWKDFFLTGTGMTNGMSVMINNGIPSIKETHNQYLLYLVEYGIIGFILYMLFMKRIISIVKRSSMRYLPLALCGLAMCIVTFFLNTDKGRSFWVVVAIINYIWYHNEIINSKS